MPNKQYQSPEIYEKKLVKVMEKLSVEKYDWDYNRHGAWITFFYKGQAYRFEHTVASAKERGLKIYVGSDAFAQLVLALEDLARIVSRGIYDLSAWVSGMKALPDKAEYPWWVLLLGLEDYPSNEEIIDKAFKKMAHIYHPDKGGSSEQFNRLQKARFAAHEYLKNDETSYED